MGIPRREKNYKESEEDASKREFLEETGIPIEKISFISSDDVYLNLAFI